MVAVALEGALSDGGGAASIGAALTTVVPDAAVEVESSDSTVVPDAAVEVDRATRGWGRVAAAPGDEQGGARCQRSQHQATTHGSPGLDHVYVPARGCRAHTIGFGGGSCQLDPAGSLTREYPDQHLSVAMSHSPLPPGERSTLSGSLGQGDDLGCSRVRSLRHVGCAFIVIC